MNKILKHFGWFYIFWQNLIHPLAMAVGRRVTANTISVLRAFGTPFVVILVLFDYTMAGFTVFLTCALADSFDGAVAKARAELGFADDPKLGAFLDAFCDKMFFISLVTALLPMGNYGNVTAPVKISFFVACVSSILIETILAGIRVSDYQFEKRSNGLEHKERLLNSTLTGKLKFMLQMIGAGGLVFAQPNMDHWAFYVGTTSLMISVPFALESLMQKLRARK